MTVKKPAHGEHHIFIVSDATGETAEKVVIAALSQFGESNVVTTRYKEVRTEPQILSLVDEAAAINAMIVHTIISPPLRALLDSKATRRKVPSVDLMGALLVHLTAYLGSPPLSQPGLLHKIDADYFKRIDAVDFTVKHDDGQSLQTLHEADIVLVGVSRTTKTPLSIYLARDSWKVANIPLVYGIEPPAELFAINQRRIVGLTIDPQRLADIRKARIKHLLLRGGITLEYADPDYVMKELSHSQALFTQHPEWIVLDVTGRAVEELANDIVSRVMGRERKL